MTSIYIILSLLGLIGFVALGYYLWSRAYEKYEYNIFNLGVIIRGLLSLGCLFMGGVFLGEGLNFVDAIVWLLAFIILWLWTFIATWLKTDFFLAFFALLYQLFAVIMIKTAISRFIRAVN